MSARLRHLSRALAVPAVQHPDRQVIRVVFALLWSSRLHCRATAPSRERDSVTAV